MPDILEDIGEVFKDWVAPIALSFVNPALGAAYTGIKTGAETGDPLAGFLSGAGSYAGNAIGADIGGEVFGNTMIGNATAPVQNAFETATGQAFGSSIGSGIGSYAGNQLASNLYTPTQDVEAPAKWSPTRKTGFSAPSNIAGLDPKQQSSAIASQGVYGGGAGADENNYFLQLMNNRLMDDPGGTEALSPMEMAYLEKLGLGGKSSEYDLLQGMENYA